MVHSSGAFKGKPVIHYGPVAASGNLKGYGALFTLYGQRMAEKAKGLF